ncbi:MAG: hypothetical protein KJ922_02930, partial [Nanoarchaeota archaeon]|nr:hypothetical protein [Nanoarchaeota archaeon]
MGSTDSEDRMVDDGVTFEIHVVSQKAERATRWQQDDSHYRLANKKDRRVPRARAFRFNNAEAYATRGYDPFNRHTALAEALVPAETSQQPNTSLDNISNAYGFTRDQAQVMQSRVGYSMLAMTEVYFQTRLGIPFETAVDRVAQSGGEISEDIHRIVNLLYKSTYFAELPGEMANLAVAVDAYVEHGLFEMAPGQYAIAPLPVDEDGLPPEGAIDMLLYAEKGLPDELTPGARLDIQPDDLDCRIAHQSRDYKNPIQEM